MKKTLKCRIHITSIPDVVQTDFSIIFFLSTFEFCQLRLKTIIFIHVSFITTIRAQYFLTNASLHKRKIWWQNFITTFNTFGLNTLMNIFSFLKTFRRTINFFTLANFQLPKFLFFSAKITWHFWFFLIFIFAWLNYRLKFQKAIFLRRSKVKNQKIIFVYSLSRYQSTCQFLRMYFLTQKLIFQFRIHQTRIVQMNQLRVHFLSFLQIIFKNILQNIFYVFDSHKFRYRYLSTQFLQLHRKKIHSR